MTGRFASRRPGVQVPNKRGAHDKRRPMASLSRRAAWRTVAGALLGLSLTGLPGCAVVEMSQEFARASLRMFTPRTSDYRDYNEEPGDDWSIVGDEARNIYGVERDPDRWYKNLQSEKARQIERNTGVD